MARVKWAGGTKPVCRASKHKKIVINSALKSEKGTHKVYRCSVCGAIGTEKVSG